LNALPPLCAAVRGTVRLTDDPTHLWDVTALPGGHVIFTPRPAQCDKRGIELATHLTIARFGQYTPPPPRTGGRLGFLCRGIDAPTLRTQLTACRPPIPKPLDAPVITTEVKEAVRLANLDKTPPAGTWFDGTYYLDHAGVRTKVGEVVRSRSCSRSRALGLGLTHSPTRRSGTRCRASLRRSG
jgi:hypothetical protein